MSGPTIVRKAIRVADAFLALLEALLVAVLVAMIVLVFCNVVLRYGFRSGIAVTDEVSRMMFVWIAFVGAIAVSRRHEHLGIDAVVAVLPAPMKRLVHALGNLTILGCCLALGRGAWAQMLLNLSNAAPISGLPMALTYTAPWLGCMGIGCIALTNALGAILGLSDGTMASGKEDPGA